MKDFKGLLENNMIHSDNVVSPKLIGKSPVFLNTINIANKLKGCDFNIFIQGETGTGKQTLARYIHSLENDSQRPFIEMSCAGLNEYQFELYFFGQENDSATQSKKPFIGGLELANGGDLFLNHVDSLKIDLQYKLLRTIQSNQIYRIGSYSPTNINVRIISSSSKSNLERARKQNLFRDDLYYRLKVVELNLPPLRERINDLPKLVTHFLEHYSRGNVRKRFTREAAKTLKSYKWPGNILELKNVIQNCEIFSQDDTISNQTVHDAINAQNSGKKKNKSNEEIYEI